MNSLKGGLNRREFIQVAGALVPLSVVQVPRRRVWLVVDPSDPIAGAAQSQWAATELEQTLNARGLAVHRGERVTQAKRGDFCVVAAGLKSSVTAKVLRAA